MGNRTDILIIVLPVSNTIFIESEVNKMVNTEYVQDLMNEHGWTLGQLSVKSGISKAQLSRIMSDKRGAGSKTMEGLIRAFS